MSYGNYYEGPPRRRTSRTLVRLVMFVWLLVFSCVGLRAFAIPAVNNFVADFFTRRVVQAINPNIASPSVPNLGDVRDSVEEAVLPNLLPVLPTGEFPITDEQATGYMASQAGALNLDRVEVQFAADEVIATVGRGPLSGTIRANARAENGRIVLENEQIEGLLGQVIQAETIITPLETRLNNEIQQQGRQVAGIDIQPGTAIITIQ